MANITDITEDRVRQQLESAVSELTTLLSTTPMNPNNLRTMPKYLEKVARVIRSFLKQ